MGKVQQARLEIWPREDREDAHIDLGHKEVLSAQNRGAAEPLRERQARKK